MTRLLSDALFCGCQSHDWESEVVQEAFQSLEERMTYDQFFRISEPKRVKRSDTVRGPPMQIDGYANVEYHTFNFKAYPSTTGLRHRGYIKFHKPKSGVDKPMQQLEVEVDCECPDYKYMWAWANKQRGSGSVGPRSLNKNNGKAPKVKNKSGTPGLCKHLLAARNYIYGQISKFPIETGGDLSIALDKLVKHADTRWIDYEGEMVKGRERERKYKRQTGDRNTWGPTGKPPAKPTPPEMQKPTALPPDDGKPKPPEKPGKFVQPSKFKGPPPLPPSAKKPPEKPGGKPPGKPGNKPGPKPPKKPGGDKGGPREESAVVRTAIMKNQALLEARRSICEVAASMGRNKRKPGAPPEGGDSLDAADEKFMNSALSGDEGMGGPEDDLGADAGAPPMGDEGGGTDMPLDDFPPMDVGGDAGMGAPSAAPAAPEDEALGLLRSIAAGIGRLADEMAPTESGGPDKPKDGADKEKKAEKAPKVPPVGDEGEDDDRDEGKGEEGTDDDDGPSDIPKSPSKKSKMPRIAGV